MKDEEIQDLIKQTFETELHTDQIKIPEDIKPKNLEHMLDQARIRREKKRKRNKFMKAACIVAVLGVSLTYIANQMHLFPYVEHEYSEQISHLTYSQIYDVFEDQKKAQDHEGDFFGNRVMEDAGVSSDMSKAQETTSESKADGGFTKTDVQVEGIDESDIIKTDGHYLYCVTGNNDIDIVKPLGHQTQRIATISTGAFIKEIYLNKNQLIILAYENSGRYNGRENTVIYFYDVADAANPKLISSLEQDGSLTTSRISDGYLYLFSSCWIDVNGSYHKDTLESYVPVIDGKVLSEKDIYGCRANHPNEYSVFTSIDLKNPTKFTCKKGFLSSEPEVYVNEKHIYINTTNDNRRRSSLTKYDYEKGKITYKKAVSLDGYVHDNYSMDEKDGYLRMVATVNGDSRDDDYNNLYILDSNLKMVSNIQNIARGEEIYSSRFIGDVAYVVTYRNTDPLFRINLKDPKKPVIESKLKIPGFSSYLHPYDKNLLLGVGKETPDPSEVAVDRSVSDSREGVKLSMFDTSYPTKLREVAKYVKENSYSNDILTNNKALLIDRERNLFGFGSSNVATGDNKYEYTGVTYKKGTGFKEQFVVDAKNEYVESSRGVRIGNTLYILFFSNNNDSSMKMVDLKTMKEETKSIDFSVPVQ